MKFYKELYGKTKANFIKNFLQDFNFFFYQYLELKLHKIEEHSDFAVTLSNMGLIYSDFGQKEKALEIIEKVYSKK